MITFFGKMFPDANRVAGKIYWDGHFPDGSVDPAAVGGFGPAGVAVLVLDLRNGFTIKQKWGSEIQKASSGKEKRISHLDAPQQWFSGSALLTGDDLRAMRAKLARFAALGSVFMLGLQHEQLSLQADSSGTTLTVSTLRSVDWKKRGQRVLVKRGTVAVAAVIQSVSGSQIVLDVAPGDAGLVGGVVMPLFPVYLEPQQDFPRYPVNAEEWNLRARAAIFDFAPEMASLDLGTVNASPTYDGVIIYARDFGAIGNTRTLAMAVGAVAADYNTIVESGGAVTYRYEAGVTTLDEMAATLELSSYLIMGGTYNGSTVIEAGDAFSATALTGGEIAGSVGNGATLTTYAGDGTARPVWTRYLDNSATENDGVLAMTRILDHGGVPYALGTASRSDFHRYVTISEGSQPDWQWFKLFLSTVKGAQKSFWLPTWRPDMTFVSRTLPGGGVTEMVVSTADGSDVFGWWPDQRQYVQVGAADGTLTRAKITAAVDNGDGTATLTLDQEVASSAVVLISWLELCRFEKDEFDIAWSESGFSVDTTARVVQQ